MSQMRMFAKKKKKMQAAIGDDLFIYFYLFLFTQYFKRVTHLAKSSHSTKWPSTNILNSLKTHIT